MTTVRYGVSGCGAQETGAHAAHEDKLRYGIPVIVCRPHEHQGCAGKCDRELDHPSAWQTESAQGARRSLASYRPGVDTFAMVTGWGVDAIDIDTKNGAVVEDEVAAAEAFGVVVVGIDTTPSGGKHLFVASTGIASAAKPVNGVDFRGGCTDGSGRGLIYLPGAHRPRYPGRDYSIAESIDWALLDRLDVAQQRAALDAYLTSRGIKVRTIESGDAASEEVLPEPLDRRKLPGDLKRRLKEPVAQPDRSEKLHRLVADCYRANLTKGQTVTAITPWCQMVSREDGKYIGQEARHVALSWAKIEAEDLEAQRPEHRQQMRRDPSALFPPCARVGLGGGAVQHAGQFQCQFYSSGILVADVIGRFHRFPDRGLHLVRGTLHEGLQRAIWGDLRG